MKHIRRFQKPPPSSENSNYIHDMISKGDLISHVNTRRHKAHVTDFLVGMYPHSSRFLTLVSCQSQRNPRVKGFRKVEGPSVREINTMRYSSNGSMLTKMQVLRKRLEKCHKAD